jgi:hypothetical protein
LHIFFKALGAPVGLYAVAVGASQQKVVAVR